MSADLSGTGFHSALVTGASGFIGRALVRRLEQTGTTVTGSSRREMKTRADGPRWVSGDVTDPDFTRRLVATAGADVIFHLAGEVSGSRELGTVQPTLQTNLLGGVNMLTAAAEIGCDRLIFIGSGDEPVPHESPCSPYAAAKACLTTYARMFCDLYGTPVTTARVFMAYGPDQPDETKVVPYVITSLLRGVGPALSSGQRRCDWVYIDDVVGALLALAVSPGVVGRVVDVGTGALHTVRHVVDTIVELSGAVVRPAWGELPDRLGETENVADAAESARMSGWSASTNLRGGLERTVEWYAARQSC